MTVQDLINMLKSIEHKDDPIVIDFNNARKWRGNFGTLNEPVAKDHIVSI